VKTLTAPTSQVTDEDVPWSLGWIVDSYLDAHGYQTSAIFHIVNAYEQANNVSDFVHSLCTKGMALWEVYWIWENIEYVDEAATKDFA
jgi:hypothetical protein